MIIILAMSVSMNREPGPPSSIRARLGADVGSLAPAQGRLARYLLDHFASASDLRITDLAEEAGVSIGTVSQLCRRLGLRGYQDLRLGLAREAVSLGSDDRDVLGTGPTETSDPLRRSTAGVFAAAVEALVETHRQLAPSILASAVERIVRARRVEWVGIGSAGLVAAEGALKLRKLGADTVAHFDSHQQAMSASLLDARDLVIAVSHSGRTMDVLESVRVAREAGATVIAITGVSASPLARAADVVLPTVSHDTGFQVEPMASTLAQLAVVQALFLGYLERAGEPAQLSLSRTQSALESRHVKGRLT